MKEGPPKVPWTHGTVELQHRFAETEQTRITDGALSRETRTPGHRSRRVAGIPGRTPMTKAIKGLLALDRKSVV